MLSPSSVFGIACILGLTLSLRTALRDSSSSFTDSWKSAFIVRVQVLTPLSLDCYVHSGTSSSPVVGIVHSESDLSTLI